MLLVYCSNIFPFLTLYLQTSKVSHMFCRCCPKFTNFTSTNFTISMLFPQCQQFLRRRSTSPRFSIVLCFRNKNCLFFRKLSTLLDLCVNCFRKVRETFSKNVKSLEKQLDVRKIQSNLELEQTQISAKVAYNSSIPCHSAQNSAQNSALDSAQDSASGTALLRQSA